MGIVCTMSKALLGWFYTIEFSYTGKSVYGNRLAFIFDMTYSLQSYLRAPAGFIFYIKIFA